MTEDTRTHKVYGSALFLKYAPSYHLFLQVQGEIAGTKHPVYSARPCGGGWGNVNFMLSSDKVAVNTILTDKVCLQRCSMRKFSYNAMIDS